MMKFVRENIFLVATLAAVVVFGGIILGFGVVTAGNRDEALSQRRKLSDNLADLKSAAPVNTRILEEKKAWVAKVLAIQQTVLDTSIDWNRQGCDPFALTFNTAQGPRRIPAFPVDRGLYQQYDLTFTAANVYRAELKGLLARLKPVRPYTKEEEEKERALWEKKLRDDWQLREREGLEELDAAEEGDIAVADDRPHKAAPAAAEPPAGIAERSSKMAQNSLLVKHAKEGMIYASPRVLDMVRAERDVWSIAQIWEAQLNYWITRDITEAIQKTNEDRAGSLPEGKELSVLNAAVKELVKIEIDERPVKGEAVTETKRPRGRAKKAKAKEAPDTARLTQRASSEQYDIFQYSFTVIMPISSLNALQRNLMKRNYHAILSVRAEQMPKAPVDRYYGTDPVMRVTITGELLLLAAWTRGTEGDSMMTEHDVLNWRAFTTKLSRQARQHKPSAGKHIWLLLSQKLRQRIAGGSISRATKRITISELNGLLNNEGFYDEDSWLNVKLSLWESALLAKLSDQTIKKTNIPHLNRALLKAAFPAEIARSQYLPPMMPVEATKERTKR